MSKFKLKINGKPAKKGEILLISPGYVKMMMTGVDHITQDHNGLVTLVYHDNNMVKESKESAKIDKCIDDWNYFDIVATVQTIARRK